MNHQFRLKIDPILGTGHVLLNQQPLFAQSQLQVCATQSFFDWYTDLPDLMYAEVNDNYSMTVECMDIQYRLLCGVFAQVGECREIRHIPLNLHYSVEQRFSWLAEAAAKMNFSLPEIPQFSVQTCCAGTQDFQSVKNSLPAFYQARCVSSLCQVNLWLARTATLGSVPQGQISDADAVVCLNSGHRQTQLGQVPIFYETDGNSAGVIVKWIDQMILMPYLAFCQERLLQQMRNPSFDVVSRIRMLTRDEPYVVLRIPSRLECGTTGAISLEEFPQSPLSLKISDQNILSLQNGKLLAQKPGRTSVAVISQSGQLLQEETVEAYFVTRVTSITLTSNKGSSILLGDTFTVQADCRPHGAVNISQSVWSVSPSNVLQNMGGGRFLALGPGTCSVRLTIGKVSQDIHLSVIPAPTDLQLPSEIRCKVNASPQRVSAKLLPNGSACKTIRCSVADRSIAHWDPASKCIVPVAEGTTMFEAIVVDPTGKAMFTKKCRITILPEKDIITPPALLTLAACCAILTILTLGSVYAFLFPMGCLILCGAALVTNAIPWAKHTATKGQKTQAIIGLIGMIASLIILLLEV